MQKVVEGEGALRKLRVLRDWRQRMLAMLAKSDAERDELIRTAAKQSHSYARIARDAGLSKTRVAEILSRSVAER